MVFGPDQGGLGLTMEQLGWAFTPAFWGFTLAMMFGGPLVDAIGMKKITSKIFNQNGVKTIGLDETVKSQRPITKIISCAYALCLCYCIYIVWSKT
jgi:MFS family permease